MNNPLVSIIMPAYNVEKYIVDSINSVINQTYQNWELIIVDDYSSDNTKNKIIELQKNDNRIRIIFNEKNSGRPSIAKNIALEKANGDYIAFLDSDDMWFESKLAKQIEQLEKNDYVLCYSGGYYIDENNNILKEFIPQYPNGNIIEYLLFRYELNNQSVIIKKDVLKKFNEDIVIGEDYNLFMNIAAKYKICSIKEKLIMYRLHKSSITKNKIHDLSQGVLFTLNELNNIYSIKYKYPFHYFISWANAMRHKLSYFIQKSLNK